MASRGGRRRRRARAARDVGGGRARAAAGSHLARLDAIDVVYCQTWQYDDPPRRLADRLVRRAAPPALLGDRRDHAAAARAGQRGAHPRGASSTSCSWSAARRWRRSGGARRRGSAYPYSFKPAEKRPFPWEAPFHPAEVAHEVFQAWLTFAIFDNARRAHLGVGLDEYRMQLGEQWAPFTRVAAANPEAWFPIERSAGGDHHRPGPSTGWSATRTRSTWCRSWTSTWRPRSCSRRTRPPTRSASRPTSGCTCAGSVLRDRPGVRRRAPRPVAVTRDGGGEPRPRCVRAGVGIDDIAHLDLYSCFGSSVNFARDALGLAADDPRGFTVTGGLPYHGGAGSDYVTHSIATMAGRLRADPGSVGLVSGVGMHMTKHVFGVYSTEPGPVGAAAADRRAGRGHDRRPPRGHGDGRRVLGGRTAPTANRSGVSSCATCPAGAATARIDDRDRLLAAETEELIGSTVTLVARRRRQSGDMRDRMSARWVADGRPQPGLVAEHVAGAAGAVVLVEHREVLGRHERRGGSHRTRG